MDRWQALGIASVVMGAAAVGFAAQGFLESPSPDLAAAAAATEWSARLVVATLLPFGLALAVVRKRRKIGAAGLALAVSALALGLTPWLAARSVARELGVSLSWTENLLGPASPAVAEEAGIPFTGDEDPRRLDVYRAPGAGPHPAVVVVHGGGWVGGNRSEIADFDRWLASEGVLVFDADYRLAPAPNWKAAVGDVKCAVAWVRRRAAEYGVDPGRIALLGRSAGGHLALLAAYAATSPQLPATCSGDARVAAVVAYYPPTDLARGYAHPANPRVMDGQAMLRRLLGGAPDEVPALYRLNSPTTYVGPGTPPTLLFHGGKDQYVRPENTDLLDERLARSAVPHETVRLPWAQHGFDFAEGGWGDQIARHEVRAFLARTLASP